MEIVDLQWWGVAAVFGWTAAVVMILVFVKAKAKRRTAELMTAKRALSAHYAALEAIVGDPALPLPALEFLNTFTGMIQDERICHEMTDHLAKFWLNREKRRSSPPAWLDTIEKLRKDRPDLVEGFYDAIGHGLVAMFTLWPGTGWKLQYIMMQIASDRHSQVEIATSMTQKRERSNWMPSGAIPA